MKKYIHFIASILVFSAVCFPSFTQSAQTAAAATVKNAVSNANAADLDLLLQAEKNGFSLYFDPLTGTGIIEKNSHQISFRSGDNFVLHDFKKITLVDPPVSRNGKILVTKKFIDDAEKLFKADNENPGLKIGAILIDAGHGGKDPGAQYTHTVKGKKITVVEKDVNLSVSKMLYSRLKSAYPDKKILMTREKDVFLSLAERTEIANNVKLKENEAVLYISIHVNASMDKKASGYEVWYLSPGYRRTVIDKNDTEDNLFPILNSMMEEEYTTESILIAKFILDGLKAQVGDKSQARGIKAEEWFVVRNSNMPAVLVELGFLTNEKEGLLLADNSYLQKEALGIYNGLTAFITHFELSRGFTQ